jgi:vesicle-associated membrane protein 7
MYRSKLDIWKYALKCQIYLFTTVNGLGPDTKKKQIQQQQQMSDREILCAVIMMNGKLLSEFANGRGGNCRDAIVNVIHPKLNGDEVRRTLKQSPFEFHYKTAGNQTIFAVTDSGFKKKTVWAFVDEVEREVLKLGLVANFENVRKVLRQKMTYYNNPENDKLIDLHTKMDNIKDVHVDNMDKILKSTDKEKMLEDKNKVKQGASSLRKQRPGCFSCFGF